MIYTIGRRESYQEVLERQGAVYKLGRRPDYPGGSVWPTPEEAAAYLAEKGLTDYGVYLVVADWKMDTAPSIHGGPWHDLLRDAAIAGYWDPKTGTECLWGTFAEAANRLATSWRNLSSEVTKQVQNGIEVLQRMKLGQ